MKTAAFTIWFNDLPMLDLWLKYYSKYFDDLYVICSATKDEYVPFLEERKKKYNLNYERVGDLSDTRIANEKVKETQIKLLENHEWVIYSNLDEIIATNPKKYSDLKDFMNRYKRDWLHCFAYDVIEWEEPPIDFTKPILQQRKYWVKNYNMNKVLISRVPLKWNEGQHQIEEIPAEESKKLKNKGLYLIHLRHFNLEDDDKNPRDFGPFMHGPSIFVLERRKDSRLVIPAWVKTLI
jgi:hypothetical protein